MGWFRTELVPIDLQGLSVKIVLITNRQTRNIGNFKSLFFSSRVECFCSYLLEWSSSVFNVHWVDLLRSTSPSLIRSTFLRAGTRAALRGGVVFFACSMGISHCYTTASASPATTNIHITTAVPTTLQIQRFSWKSKLNKYWKQRWTIYLINIVLYIDRICQYGVLLFFELETCLLSTVLSPTPPSICLVLSHLCHLTSGCLLGV